MAFRSLSKPARAATGAQESLKHLVDRIASEAFADALDKVFRAAMARNPNSTTQIFDHFHQSMRTRLEWLESSWAERNRKAGRS